MHKGTPNSLYTAGIKHRGSHDAWKIKCLETACRFSLPCDKRVAERERIWMAATGREWDFCTERLVVGSNACVSLQQAQVLMCPILQDLQILFEVFAFKHLIQNAASLPALSVHLWYVESFFYSVFQLPCLISGKFPAAGKQFLIFEIQCLVRKISWPYSKILSMQEPQFKRTSQSQIILNITNFTNDKTFLCPMH